MLRGPPLSTKPVPSSRLRALPRLEFARARPAPGRAAAGPPRPCARGWGRAGLPHALAASPKNHVANLRRSAAGGAAVHVGDPAHPSLARRRQGAGRRAGAQARRPARAAVGAPRRLFGPARTAGHPGELSRALAAEGPPRRPRRLGAPRGPLVGWPAAPSSPPASLAGGPGLGDLARPLNAPHHFLPPHLFFSARAGAPTTAGHR